MADTAEDADPVRAADDMLGYLTLLQQREEGNVRAMSTGFPDLDEMLSGGIRRGEVVLVAARPKVGKTGFALSVVRHRHAHYD